MIQPAKALVLFAMLLLPLSAYADKGVALKSTLAETGNSTLEDRFDEPKLGGKWTVNKGSWEIKEGAVVGREKPADKHAAVLTLNQPHRNSILRFSFKLNGTEGFNLSFNHAKGHLFRVIVTSRKISVSKDKDKKDPQSKSRNLASADAQFASNSWHTMLVEVLDDKVSIVTDNDAKLTAQDPSLNVDKTGYRFVVRGGDLHLDDLNVSVIRPKSSN